VDARVTPQLEILLAYQPPEARYLAVHRCSADYRYYATFMHWFASLSRNRDASCRHCLPDAVVAVMLMQKLGSQCPVLKPS